MRAQAGLTFGGTPSDQKRGRKLDVQLGTALAQCGQQTPRQKFGLVESAAAPFLPVQWHRDGQQISRKLGNGQNLLREKRAQAFRQRLHAVVFQQVQQAPQLTLVDAVGDGDLKVRRGCAAGAAQGFTGEASFRIDGFAAAGAKRPGLGGKIVPAGGANRKEGETSKREAADAAVGGE
jgi:hypothetical protein